MPDTGGPLRCLAILGVFVVLVAPLYLMFRLMVRMLRDAYGFASGGSEALPPLRVCGGCHNTVMEDDFTCCPYCGRALEPVAVASGAGEPTVLDETPVAATEAGTDGASR